MSLRSFFALALAAGLALVTVTAQAGLTDGFKKGSPELKSAGPLAFGPEGILFVGDPKGASIVAIDTGDKTATSAGEINVTDIDSKVAARLGTDAKQVQIVDLAVNPASSNVYLSVARGQGPDAMPVILRVDTTGKIDEVSLKNVNYSQVSFSNVPDESAKDRRGNSTRMEAITDLAYTDGRLIVAGLSNEEFASKLRSIPFPFKEADAGASVEIYHGAHGAFETRSPVRTFAIYNINREPHVLAAYTCTPLVKFPMSELKAGAKVKGTTVAELGNGNRPLDMIVYQKEGKDWVLTANNKHGGRKIATEKIDSAPGITEKASKGTGLPQETISSLQGVEQLDRLDNQRAVILARNAQSGVANLQTIPLP
jgi:hypothetical protein